MILEHLSENVIGGTIDVAPICRSYYTPDNHGMLSIIRECQENFIHVEDAACKYDIISEGLKMNGNEAKAIQLQEAVLGDFFEKLHKILQEMYAKVKGWFENLSKSVISRVLDIEKVITKYKDDLDETKKDFSGFEYKGFNWKESKLVNSVSGSASSIKNAQKTLADSALAGASKISNNPAVLDASKSIEKNTKEAKARTVENFLKVLVEGGSVSDAEMSAAECKEAIEKEILGTSTPDVIKGFGATSLSNMIDYVKKFKDNKVLGKLRTDTNKQFTESLKAVDDIKKKVQAIKSGFKVGESGLHAAQAQIYKVQLAATSIKNVQSAFNVVMGQLIGFEQDKFNEYKRVISMAVRYKGGEA